MDDFLLIGYTGAAADYVKKCDVKINFKSLNFDWDRLVFYVVLCAAILVVLLIAVAGYAVDAVYQRLYRLLHLPALEEKVDALTTRILQRIIGDKKE